MTRRPCTECGDLTDETRCWTCARTFEQRQDDERGNRHQRGYTNTWARLSARARRAQPWCIDCGAIDDLTADHLRWPARTLADVAVVCRPCNTKRGATPRGGDPRVTAPGPAGEAESPLQMGTVPSIGRTDGQG